MGTKQLTMNQKAKWTHLIRQRDYEKEDEETCFYCEQRFIQKIKRYQKVWDHLNNNESDNRPENLVFAHWHCNEKKRFDAELQIMAHEKLKENQRLALESLGGGGENCSTNKDTSMQPNEQIDANKEATNEAELYLIGRLLPQNEKSPIDPEIDFNDCADSIAFRCYKKYGHGSQNTIVRILKMLTSEDAPFAREKRNGRMKVFARNDN